VFIFITVPEAIIKRFGKVILRVYFCEKKVAGTFHVPPLIFILRGGKLVFFPYLHRKLS
jgi:hypothetical protein